MGEKGNREAVMHVQQLHLLCELRQALPTHTSTVTHTPPAIQPHVNRPRLAQTHDA